MNVKKLSLETEEIPYVDAGSGKDLLFIPGWGVTPATYKKTIQGLATQFHVYVPFLRQSNDQVLSIKHLIEGLGLTKPFLVGHSASGIPAVMFAYRYPEKTGGVVLIDSMGITTEGAFGASFNRWITHVAHFFSPSQKHSIGFALFLAQDFLRECALHPVKLIQEANIALKTDISYFLKQLTVPVLILWGKHDDLTPLWEGYAMKYQNDRAILEVLPGGHDWVKIKPFLLVERIKQFVSTIKHETN